MKQKIQTISLILFLSLIIFISCDNRNSKSQVKLEDERENGIEDEVAMISFKKVDEQMLGFLELNQIALDKTQKNANNESKKDNRTKDIVKQPKEGNQNNKIKLELKNDKPVESKVEKKVQSDLIKITPKKEERNSNLDKKPQETNKIINEKAKNHDLEKRSKEKVVEEKNKTPMNKNRKEEVKPVEKNKVISEVKPNENKPVIPDKKDLPKKQTSQENDKKSKEDDNESPSVISFEASSEKPEKKDNNQKIEFNSENNLEKEKARKANKKSKDNGIDIADDDKSKLDEFKFEPVTYVNDISDVSHANLREDQR